jgi:hypothetical protein
VFAKQADPSALTNPSIVIDYTAIGGAGEPNPNPHIRNVGRQTWAPTTQGTAITIPFPNIQQSNNMTDVLNSSSSIFRQTGAITDYSYEQGSVMENWIGGTQFSTLLDAGLITIGMGEEDEVGTNLTSNFMHDNSLELSVRNSINTEEYISLGKGKLGLATPLVLKRVRGKNAAQNQDPSYDATQASSVNAPPHNWGWDTTNVFVDLGGGYPSGWSNGMPTAGELNVPLIFLNYGPGEGYNDLSNITTNNEDYNYTFNFPVGSYPGQKLTLIVRHQRMAYTFAGKSGNVQVANYGAITIKIPKIRMRYPIDTSYSDWMHTFTGTGTPTGYHSVTSTSNAWEAVFGKGSMHVIELIWDGTEITKYGINGTMSPGAPSGVTREPFEIQHGWAMISNSEIEGNSWSVVNLY